MLLVVGGTYRTYGEIWSGSQRLDCPKPDGAHPKTFKSNTDIYNSHFKSQS